MKKRITTILPLLMLFAILGAGMMIPMYPFWVDHDSYGSNKHVVNVMSPKYGATGDGSTDDTVAIQAAIDAADAAGGGKVFMPVGTYKITSTLDLKENCILQGDGWNTLLNYTGSGIAIRLTAASYTAWYVSLDNFRLIDAGTGTHGVQIYNVANIIVNRLFINGFSTAGVHLSGPSAGNSAVAIGIYDCLIWGNGDGILVDNPKVNHIRIIGNTINSNTGFGIQTSGGTHLSWIIAGNGFDNNVNGALRFDTIQGISINGNHFEDALGYALPHIKFTGVNWFNAGVSIKGNFFTGTNYAIHLDDVRGVEISGNDNNGYTSGTHQAFIYIPDKATVNNYRFANNGVLTQTTHHVKIGTVGSGRVSIVESPNEVVRLADDATPSVLGATVYLTGGTTTITDFDDGTNYQIITIISEHAITITDGTNIFLNGSTNWAMTTTDTLTLIQKADGKWYEISRSDSGA